MQGILEIWRRASLTHRVILLSVVLACAVGGAVLVNWARQPKMALLYGGLNPEEASEIVDKLRDEGVAYELTDGGTAVLVPEGKVYNLRLSLAGKGLPAGGQGGYRILDSEKIGASPFKQRVNYRRAVEGELAQTVQMFEPVVSARVHIARTEPSLFAGRSKDASATVAVQLRGGHRLTGANVAAIVHMVAGSVEGLTADRVVVVDSAGKLLSNQASGELARGGGSYLDYKQSVEDYFARKAEDMLAAVLGPERASVRVEATIDVADLTQTTETYDPDKRVVTKEEIKSKSSTPPATGGEGAPAGGGTREETTMSEYRVSRTVQQRRDLPGKVQSLSVAALVDLTGAAEAEGEDAPAAKLTVTDVEEIIRQATNAENIKVVDAPFHQPRAAAGAEAEQAGFLNQDFLLEIAKRSSLAVLVIGALLALKLFGGSGKAKQAALPGEGQQTTVQQVGSGGSAQMRAQIAQALQQDPEQVRQLFLSWAKSDGGGE